MSCRFALIVGFFALFPFGSLQAQMFRPIQAAQSDTNLQNAGLLTGDRRFLRQNRRRGDFVGRDTEGTQGFVGETQGRTTGRVPTAVSTLPPEPVLPVNAPRPAAARTGIYEPRLTIGFDVDRQPDASRSQQVQTRLNRALAQSSRAAIVVSVHDGIATLVGEVDSEEAKEMAALVVQFEPGVKSVRNELTVRAPAEPQVPSTSP